MIHLSRLTFDPRRAETWRDVRHPYEMHRTILKAFGTRAGESGVLFRIENPDENPFVLVQSVARPDWSLAGDHLCAEGPKEVRLALAQGDRFRFRLLARPSKKTADVRNDKGQGKRVDLRDPDEILKWIHEEGEGRRSRTDPERWLKEPQGFRVLDVEPTEVSLVTRSVTGQALGAREKGGSFRAVRYDGVLEVTDAVAFETVVRTGLGPQKAFGFGLLSVGRAK